MDNRYIAIMAGGIGSRFWPESRLTKPKQFLDILNTGQSLLQLTFERAKKLVKPQNIIIVSNHLYKELILEQIPQIRPENILLEPARRNTGPCVAYTALHLEALDSDAVFAILPSDHIINDEEAFLKSLNKAFDHASNHDDIVTLGIKPERPDTGYGYIHYDSISSGGIHKVRAFKEKPTLDTAKSYLSSGNYLWNAGMFIWSVNSVIHSFRTHAPDIIEALCINKKLFGTPNEQSYIDEVYHEARSISVDYAILEVANNVVTIPSDIGWSDLGTWNSLFEYQEKTDQNNVAHNQNTHLIEVEGSLVRS